MKNLNAALRPRVSVIITTAGETTHLRYALESVIAQTFVNFEVWVIGDHCIDITEDVVHSFCDPRLMWFNTPAQSRNEFHLILEGLKRCRGSYVAFLRDEDVWLPNHLEVMVNAIETNGIDVAFSITQCVHARDYSSLNVPTLPDLTTLPELSSVIHKRDCIFLTHPESDQDDFLSEFFRRARLEKLSMEAVPVVTGLRFLSSKVEQDGLLQAFYMERLTTDPHFVNRELSAILLRSERFQLDLEGRLSWASWIAKPLQRVLKAVIRRKSELISSGQREEQRSARVHAVVNNARTV